MLTVGDIRADQSTKTHGVLTVSGCEGVAMDVPVILINGTEPGPVLWVTAGIHGAEYPSIEAAIQLATELSPHDLHGAVVILPIVNTAAFFARSMYVCPVDNKNINRVFPGNPDGSLSEVVASTLMQTIAPQVSHVIDLHGGDMIEALTPLVSIKQVQNDLVNAKARELALHFGLETLVEVPHEGEEWTSDGTLTKTMAQRGVPTLLAEAGGCGLMDADSVALLSNGVRNVMTYLHMLPGPLPPSRVTERYYGIVRLFAAHQGLLYPNVQAGDRVTPGQSLGEIRDVFGAVLDCLICPVNGKVLYILSSPAVQHEDLVMGIGKSTS